MHLSQIEPSSFRDRSGYVFYNQGFVYRAILSSYKEDFDLLCSSGLYDALVSKDLLVSHEEVPVDSFQDLVTHPGQTVYKVLKVAKVPFISYPYEWCFQQLKEAALLTLEIQLTALQHGMILKDASAFNVQFIGSKPVFIDTLSFAAYDEGKPWMAYRQFCTHFLAPLALVSRVHPDLRRMSQLFIDGIPLSVASSMLPYKTRFSPFYQMHLHYHSKMESKFAGDVKAGQKVRHNLSKTRLTAIVSHLQSGIAAMNLPISKTEWGDYYQEFSYSDASIEDKKRLVKQWAGEVAPAQTWDLGCNTGLFSELVQSVSGQVTSFDIDHLAIEKFYHALKAKPFNNVLPLVLDLSNPTAAIGWANSERKSFAERGSADLILALALIHHISIGNNVPFEKVAELFSRLTEWLIIEFVPKSDPQSQRLLVTREDVFSDYNQGSFEARFEAFFTIEKQQLVAGTERTLYLMKRK
jgi:ribosomal protein L11 methylase PrmA